MSRGLCIFLNLQFLENIGGVIFMLNLQYAKPKEELLNAPLDIQFAIEECLTYWDLARELKNDIIDKFNSPVLTAAIDSLLELSINREKALAELTAAGYTIDDVFMYEQYGNED